MKNVFALCLLLWLAVTAVAQPFTANWITTSPNPATTPNTWHCFRKTIQLSNVPGRATLRLAVDSKYWLWINGRQVVYEGGLKRGPNPRDTYFDEVDMAPYLQPGANTVAVLVWFWGGKGFTHKNSGRMGLYADCPALGFGTGPDWKAISHPAYAPSPLPTPNFRLSEPSIFYDARAEFAGTTPEKQWFSPGWDDTAWPAAVQAGNVPGLPWNNLVKRPIPLFTDYGLRNYTTITRRPGRNGARDTLVCKLPYDAQFSPALTVQAEAGQRIFIGSDTYYMGALSAKDSLYTLGSEYITRKGLQTYESLGWLSGHEMHYLVPKGVQVKSVQFRETGYKTTFAGSFVSNDSLLTKLWRKAQRTLYVNMRDNYMDCPDRERAQWAGDAAMDVIQSFYALDTNSTALSRKLFLDLANWQRPDDVIYSPVPEENWKQELPAQSLMALSELERYFRHTRDTATIRQVYPAMKRYLALWKELPTGQLVYRKGGWDWGDWGDNQDHVLIQHGWYRRALTTAVLLANLLNQPADADRYAQQANRLRNFLNSPACWTGTAYRHKAYAGQTDDRSNALMVMAGVADSTRWEAISKVLKTQEHASPFMEKMVLESLFRMNRPQQAMERMRRRFREMTEASFSTLWELWRYELSEAHGNTGYNHAWAGGPLILLSEYVAGLSVSPIEADTYLLRPTLTDLRAVQVTMPTPKGPIQVGIHRQANLVSLTVQVPPNTTVLASLPGDAPTPKSRTLNGKPTPAQTGAVRLGPGTHKLVGQFARY